VGKCWEEGKTLKKGVKMKLTQNEKLLIADALNGCSIVLEVDHPELGPTLTPSWSSRLALEVYDAIRISRLDQKWDVDGESLLQKLTELGQADCELLLRRIAEVWRRNDENFEHDLEALDV
jgi:hypothetical protein